YDFKFFVLLSFVMVLCGVWFVQSGRDLHLAGVCFAFSVLFVSQVANLAYHQLGILFKISIFVLPLVMLNAGLRTTGREVRGGLLLAELVVCVFIALVYYAGQDNPQALQNLRAT